MLFAMEIPMMEPQLSTSPELEDVLAELSAREPIFHRPEFGTSRADFERMTVEDFWETGASGRRYSREFVLDELERRYSAPHNDVWETRDFNCCKLADDVYLLTYTLAGQATADAADNDLAERQERLADRLPPGDDCAGRLTGRSAQD